MSGYLTAKQPTSNLGQLRRGDLRPIKLCVLIIRVSHQIITAYTTQFPLYVFTNARRSLSVLRPRHIVLCRMYVCIRRRQNGETTHLFSRLGLPHRLVAAVGLLLDAVAEEVRVGDTDEGVVDGEDVHVLDAPLAHVSEGTLPLQRWVNATVAVRSHGDPVSSLENDLPVARHAREGALHAVVRYGKNQYTVQVVLSGILSCQVISPRMYFCCCKQYCRACPCCAYM